MRDPVLKIAATLAIHQVGVSALSAIREGNLGWPTDDGLPKKANLYQRVLPVAWLRFESEDGWPGRCFVEAKAHDLSHEMLIGECDR